MKALISYVLGYCSGIRLIRLLNVNKGEIVGVWC
jgi:hypothetical protein